MSTSAASSALRRRTGAATTSEKVDNSASTPAAASSASTASASASSSAPSPASGYRWFHYYYFILFTLSILAFTYYLLFIHTPYIQTHQAYDVIPFVPKEVRREVIHWNEVQKNKTRVADENDDDSFSLSPTATSIASLLSFLHSYQLRGYFDSAQIKDYDHYMQSMTLGWIAGVFEGMVMPDDEGSSQKEDASAGVDSIPGGSRRAKVRLDKLIQPYVTMFNPLGAPVPAVSSSSPLTTLAAHYMTNLTTDHQNWVYEGLSHCTTSFCNLLKLGLVKTWKDGVDGGGDDSKKLDQEMKEQMQMRMQLFHPETHAGEKLIDAPASVATLASLWYRYFSTSSEVYLLRLFDLTRLTGARAYQQEKDAEIRSWIRKKAQRKREQVKEQWLIQKGEAVKHGKSIPPQPDYTPLSDELALQQLPASPTFELFQHFFNSLLFYSEEHGPALKQAFKKTWSLYPEDPVVKELKKTKPFRD